VLKCPALPIRYSDLIRKEVINVYDGCKLGRVCDLDIDTLCGRINAIFIPKETFLFKKRQHHCIKWEQIERIGGDTILVRLSKPAPPKSECD
jgi:YlmC/YmxH family sporulation protein